MNDVDQYILNAIKVQVWSGFDSYDDIQDLISDLLEDGADEGMLRDSVDIEFNEKYTAEQSWPDITDVDKLDQVFQILNSNGILCLHNAGYTMSDGHEDAHTALSKHANGQFFGYCFYHGQDVERAFMGEGLTLAYDHIAGDVPDKIKVATKIQQALEQAGFSLEWNGTVEERIRLPNFDWKHRSTIVSK